MTSRTTAGVPVQPATKFGTFLGVYTPSILTILGVMMYLRFGWVLGNLGLPLALLTVLLASGITLITGLSASAISTNMKVGVGGEYYMVSRSLGKELGGAIGIPLFLCRTLSLTLYAFGLAESVAPFWPAEWGAAPIQLMAAGIIVVTTAIAGKSANLALKLQLPIMVAVGLSVIALVGGALSGPLTEPEMTAHYERSANGGFWFVFAVFFPAVTGFTAGIGMSGDLKDSQRSIPRGTILAVLTGAIVYLLILVMLGCTAKVDGEQLAALDPTAPPIWSKVAWLGMVLIYPGLWGAILSSAFGSALGGPRVLQALASDKLAPGVLARMSKTGQPTIATWATGAIALAAVALGDLNEVGRWVTIFFLTLYVTVNLTAALEKLVGDPSYRPTINVPWYLSLLGSFGAVAIMFLLSPLVCIAAIGLELAIFLFLRRKALKSTWGDVRAGLWVALARFALMKLRKRGTEARNWRPNILVFTANPANRIGLVRFADWFNQHRGVVTVCQVIVGDLAKEHIDIDGARREMEETLEADRLVAFSEVHVVPDFESGIVGIAQANGFAGLQSNTMMFGWSGGDEGLEMLLRTTRALARLNLNTLLVRLPEAEGPRRRRRIDLWWRGREHNGDLMLLLAHLLKLNRQWSAASIHMHTIVRKEHERAAMETALETLVAETRIHAHTHVTVKEPDTSVADTIHAASSAADVVFLGIGVPNEGEEREAAVRLNQLVATLPPTILVHNAGPFAGQLV